MTKYSVLRPCSSLLSPPSSRLAALAATLSRYAPPSLPFRAELRLFDRWAWFLTSVSYGMAARTSPLRTKPMSRLRAGRSGGAAAVTLPPRTSLRDGQFRGGPRHSSRDAFRDDEEEPASSAGLPRHVVTGETAGGVGRAGDVSANSTPPPWTRPRGLPRGDCCHRRGRGGSGRGYNHVEWL